jgi:PAS domain S-box-containing protein
MQRPLRVLYQDTDPAMRRAVRALLGADEFTVDTAHGPAAVRALLDEADDPPPACVVLSDPDAPDAVPAHDRPVVRFVDDPPAGADAETVDRRGEEALARLRTAVRRAASDSTAAAADASRAIVEAIQDPVYVLDDRGRFVRVNDAFTDLVGYSRDRIVGSSVSLVKDETAVELGEAQLRRLLADDGPDDLRFELDVEAADGTVRRCEDHMALLPSADDEFVGSAGVLRDVTERRGRERRFRRERDRVRLLFDRSPVPVVRFVIEDGVPAVAETNPAFDLTFGTDDVAPGTPLGALHTPDDEAFAGASGIAERIRVGGSIEAEVTCETPSGPREFLLNVATNVARTAAGADDATADEGYAIYVDITEQAAYEAALDRQTRWLQGFADVFAHDMAGPLNAAQGHLDLVREALGPDAPARDSLDAADRSLDRLDELVRDLSDALRAGTVDVDPEPVDLAPLAREAWASLASAAATLEVDDAPGVVADRLATKRLLENLFRNAPDHAGSDVAVAVRPVSGGFCVDDDGPGVPAEDRESVFAPGYTTDSDGTGFGLLSVQQIALAHDWSVRAASNPSGGTRIVATGVERT